MSNVDDRVVRLDFDGSGFESGAAKAIDTLDKLNDKLNLDGAAAGIDSIKKSVSKFNLDSMSDSVESVAVHFSKLDSFVHGFMERAGGEVFNFVKNIPGKVIDASTKSVRDGFAEYEQQMKSVQTIAANSGEGLEVIQQNLDELNEYADKTSYVFSDMTSAIGRFTSAGIGVEQSTKAVQGFFNAAALSGAGASAASRGVYQLSQAMSAGVVKLQDWKSIEQASIDTEKFRRIIMLTAEHLGVTDEKFEAAKKGETSFRDSLSSGWLTVDVMQAALENLTMSTLDFEDAEKGASELIKQLTKDGYTEEQAKQIVSIASAADQSAREIRTFGQMMETMKESLGSGWAKTWQLIIGDYEQSAEFFTWISGKFSSIIEASSNARNALLAQWQENGGRDALIGIVANTFEAITRIVKPVSDAFKDVFSIGGEQLAIITENFARFTEKLVISEESMTSLFDTFQSAFMIIHSIIGIIGNGVRIVGAFVSTFMHGFLGVKSVVGSVNSVLEPIAKFFNHLHALSDIVSESFDDMADKAINFIEYFNRSNIDSYKESLLHNPFLVLVRTADTLHNAIWNVVDILKSAWRISTSFLKVVWSASRPVREFAGLVLKLSGTAILKGFVLLVDLFEEITYRISDAYSKYADVFVSSARYVSRIFEDVYYVVKNFATALWDVFGSPLLSAIRGWFGSIHDFISGILPDFGNFGDGIGETIVSAFAKLSKLVHTFRTEHGYQYFHDWFQSIADTVGGPFELAFNGLSWVFNKISGIVSGPLHSAFEWLGNWISGINFSNPFNWLFDAFGKLKEWLGNKEFSNPFAGLSSLFESVKGKIGGLNLSNPFAGIFDYLKNIKIPNPFENFQIPKKLLDKLGEIRDKFKELGSSSNDARWSLIRFMKQAGQKIKTSGKNRLDSFITTFKKSWNSLKDYFKGLSTNGNSFVQNVKKIFEDIYKGISEWVHKIAESTDGFGGTIAKGFDFVIQGLGKVPGAISSLFGETKKSVENGAKTVSEGANDFKEKQKDFWKNLFGSMPSIGDVTSGIGEFMSRIKSEVMEGAKTIFTGTGDFDTSSLQSSLRGLFDFSNIKISLPDFGSPIKTLISSFSESLDLLPMDKLDEKFTMVETWLTRAGKLGFAFSGWSFLRSLTKFNKGLATQADGTGTLFSQLPKMLGEGMKGLGKAFGQDAAKEIKTGMTDISTAIKEFGKSFSPFSKKQATSKSFLQIAEGILVLAGALFVMSRIPADDLERSGEALLKLAAVSGGLIFFAAWLASMTKLDLNGVGVAMAGLGIGMIAMAGAIYLFTKISENKNIVVGMQNFKVALEMLAGSMAIILLASYGASDMIGVAATIIAMTTAIGLSIGAITLLGIIPQKIITQGGTNAGLIGAALTAFISAIALVTKYGGNVLAATLAMIPLVAAITMAIIPIMLLAPIDYDFFKSGGKKAGLIGAFLVACGIALSKFTRFGGNILGATLAMIPLVAAITLATIPIGLLSLISEESLKKGGAAVAHVGIFLTALVGVLSFVGASIGALVAAAVGMTLLVVPMTLLTVVIGLLSWIAQQNLEGMKTAVDSLTWIVADIGAMALTGLYGGGGLLLLAVGLVAVTGALILLANAIDAIDFEKFHSGMITFGQSIGEAGANVITGFLGGIASGIGQIVQSGIEMAQSFLEGLTGPNGLISHSPSEATEEIGEFSIEGFINGVANKLGEMLGMGENSGQEFLSGLSDLPDKLAKKASEAIDTFVNNIDTDKIVEKGNNITQGLIDGIKGQAWASLCAIPGDIFNAIVGGVKSLFGIQSPSTYMRDEIGLNIIQGLIEGITGDNLGLLTSAAELIFPAVKSGLGDWATGAVEKAAQFGTGIVHTIQSYAGKVGTASAGVSSSVSEGIKGMPSNASSITVSAVSGIISAMTAKVSAVKNSAASILGAVKNGLKGLDSAMKKVASDGSSAFVGGISSAVSKARSAAASLTDSAKRGLGSLYNAFYSIGVNGGSGLVQGILSKVQSVVGACAKMAADGLNAAKAKLKINSPSKEFRNLGIGVGEGFVQGINRSEGPVVKSSSNLANSVITSFSDGLTSVDIEDILDTDFDPVITPVIDRTKFDSSLSGISSMLNTGLNDNLNIGNVNYSGEIVGKLSEFGDYNKQALQAFSENAIDYGLLGNAVASALISAGVRVEMDGGQLMGYLAGEIADARRMYR